MEPAVTLVALQYCHMVINTSGKMGTCRTRARVACDVTGEKDNLNNADPPPWSSHCFSGDVKLLDGETVRQST